MDPAYKLHPYTDREMYTSKSRFNSNSYRKVFAPKPLEDIENPYKMVNGAEYWRDIRLRREGRAASETNIYLPSKDIAKKGSMQNMSLKLILPSEQPQPVFSKKFKLSLESKRRNIDSISIPTNSLRYRAIKAKENSSIRESQEQ